MMNRRLVESGADAKAPNTAAPLTAAEAKYLAKGDQRQHGAFAVNDRSFYYCPADNGRQNTPPAQPNVPTAN